MAKTLRFTEQEQDLLYKTAVSINRELVRIGQMPLRESEIAHQILEQALHGEIEVTRNGKIRVLFNQANDNFGE